MSRRILLDTSFTVAALCSWHEHHERCRTAWSRLLQQETEVLVAAHGLVEVYSVLTRMPAPHRLSPAASYQLVNRNFRAGNIIALTGRQYWEVLEGCERDGIGGGTVYDALIAKAAEAGGASVIVTLNERHFLRVAPPHVSVRGPGPE